MPPSKRVSRPKAGGNAKAPSTSRLHLVDGMESETPEVEDDDDVEVGRPRTSHRRIPPILEDADDDDEYRPAGGNGNHDSADDMEAYVLARGRKSRRAAPAAGL